MKVLNLLAILLFLVSFSYAQSQSKAPESGVYKGFASSSTVTFESPYFGADMQNTKVGVDSRLMPSIFGNLIINKDGTYKLTAAGETGRWKYDEAKQTLSFTGRFSIAEIKYFYEPEYLMIQVAFPYEGKKIYSSFSKKREAPYVKPSSPNGTFTGTVVAEPQDGVFNIIDVKTGASVKNCRGYHPSKNSNGDIAALSSFDGASDVYLYDKNCELKRTIAGSKIVATRILKKYHAVSVSPDGKHLALAGYSEGFAFGGDPAYAVIDIDGNLITRISSGFREVWKADWTDDNQLIVRGKDRVSLVNPFKNSAKIIYPKDVDFATISKDGRKLAFVKDKTISVLDVETGDVKPFANGVYDQTLSTLYIRGISWSDDGNSLACSAQGGSIMFGYNIILLSANKDYGQVLSNNLGKNWILKNGYFSW